MPSTEIAPRTPRPWQQRTARWLAHHVGPHQTIALVAGIGLAAFAVFVWAAGEVYESLRESTALSGIDVPVLQWMVAHRTEGLNAVVTAFSTIGGPVIMPIIAAVTVIALARHWRSRLPITLMVAATAGSVAATVVGKKYVARVRPDHALAVPPYEFAPSFPSGHSLNSVVVGGVVAYLLWRHLHRPASRAAVVVVGVVFALAMGMSRVYLGHHWLTDVLAGWALGAAWLALLITVHQLALAVKEHRRREAEALPQTPATTALPH